MESIQSVDWERLLLAFMHDPVDKALDISGHESRAARYASVALGRDVDWNEIKSTAGPGDSLAAAAERIPMPTARKQGERAVGPVGGKLWSRHPVSGQQVEIACGSIDEDRVCGVISNIVDGLETPRQRFLALWRLLPEKLDDEFDEEFGEEFDEEFGEEFDKKFDRKADEKPGGWMTLLPADARIPDHTLINHADITAGLWASLQPGAQGRLPVFRAGTGAAVH